MIGYTDYERGKDFKGLTFHSIRHEGGEFNTDKINLKSDATWMRVMPAKTGFVMIYEYFKKQKKLDYRLEKLN